jgi:hypothetical protein
VLVVTALVLLPGVAAAQQGVSLNIGYFAVRGEDARVAGDTIVADLFQPYPDALAFNVSDFNSATVGGEWLVPVGQYLEAGVGVSFYQRTVNSVYQDLTYESGAEIEQRLKLRIIPVTASIRFMPLGRRAAVQPYIGAGIGVFSWRYSETGDFADTTYFPDYTEVYRANFVDKGTALGPVIMGGVRIPLSLGFAFGGEIRYQRADAPIDGKDENGNNLFLGDRLDLSGFTYQANLIFRF